MKKNLLFLLIAITLQQVLFAQGLTYSGPATTPTYTQGAVRGLYYSGSGTLVINTTQSNLGNNASNYLVRIQGCFGGGIQTPITVNDLNLAASNVACFLGFAQSTQRKDTSWVYGNSISISTGNNCVFVLPDLTENIYTVSNQFVYTGLNKSTAQISGATFLPNGKIRVWNNSHTALPIEINGIAIPWVADLNPSNGTVTPRADLMPSLAAPLTGTPKITTVAITSTNEVIHLGYFNRRNSGIDLAQKGFIENLSTNIITDLAADNDAFVFTATYCEMNGVGLIGSTNPAPPAGLSSGAFKFNPITYALSAAGGLGFGINPQDVLMGNVVNESKVIYVGSPRTTPAGGTVAQYDFISNSWTNLSTGLYLTPGASSSVNYISYTGECPCYLMGGNFSTAFPSGTPRASSFTDLVKGCPSVVLPIGPELKVVSQNPPTIGWENTPDGAILEKSTDGRNFIPIHTVIGDFKFTDLQFFQSAYYRIKVGNKYSNTVVISQKLKSAMVLNQGSCFTVIFPVKTTAILYNIAGQKLKIFSEFSIVVERQNQLLILKTENEVIKLF